jgi:hypothetical protein
MATAEESRGEGKREPRGGSVKGLVGGLHCKFEGGGRVRVGATDIICGEGLGGQVVKTAVKAAQSPMVLWVERQHAEFKAKVRHSGEGESIKERQGLVG